jgi:hypothetical protein
MLALCRGCDRGQSYCPSCRPKVRRRVVRAARKRHLASAEGRDDHADHQRAYRARLAGRVSDLSSEKLPRGARVRAGGDASPADMAGHDVTVRRDDHGSDHGDACAGSGESSDTCGESSRGDSAGRPGSGVGDAPACGGDAPGGARALAPATPVRCAVCGCRQRRRGVPESTVSPVPRDPPVEQYRSGVRALLASTTVPPCSDASRVGFAARYAASPLTRPPPAEPSYYAIKARDCASVLWEPAPGDPAEIGTHGDRR